MAALGVERSSIQFCCGAQVVVQGVTEDIHKADIILAGEIGVANRSESTTLDSMKEEIQGVTYNRNAGDKAGSGSPSPPVTAHGSNQAILSGVAAVLKERRSVVMEVMGIFMFVEWRENLVSG